MNEHQALSIEVLFEGIGVSVVDTESGIIMDTTFVETPSSLWDPPLKLTSNEAFEAALKKALDSLPGQLPHRAYAAVRPTFLVRAVPAGPAAIEDGPSEDPIEAKARIAESLNQDLTDLAAARFDIGPTRYYYGIDSDLAYTLVRVLLDRNIELVSIVPYEVSSLRWAFPDGFRDAVWVIVVGDTAYKIYANAQEAYISSSRVPPHQQGYVDFLANAYTAARRDLVPPHTVGSIEYNPDFYLSAPNADTLSMELSQRLDQSIHAISNLPAVGATRSSPYSGNLLPPELRPRRYSPFWRLALLWIIVAFAAAAVSSATTNLTIARTHAQLDAVNRQYQILRPYMEAETRFKSEIERIRRILDVYQRAEREERHWSQIVPTLVNRIPRDSSHFAATLSGLSFELNGATVTASLHGETANNQALLRVLRAFDTSPFDLTFRSSKQNSDGGLEFALVTAYPANLPVVPLPIGEVDRAD